MTVMLDDAFAIESYDERLITELHLIVTSYLAAYMEKRLVMSTRLPLRVMT